MNEAPKLFPHDAVQRLKAVVAQCPGIGLLYGKKYLEKHHWDVRFAVKDAWSGYDRVKELWTKP